MALRFRFLVGVAVVGIAGSIAGAQATTITNSYTTGMQLTELDPASPANQLNIALFNTGLGTLTSVTISATGYFDTGSGANPGYQGQLTNAGSVVNNSTSPISFNVTQDSQFTFGSSDANVNAALSNINLDPATSAASATYNNLLPTASAPFGPFNLKSTGSTSLTSGFSAFESATAGTVADIIDVGTLTESTFSNTAGNLQLLVNNYAEADVKVTYDYLPATVPEPASLAIAGAGLLAIGVLRSRRRG